MKKIAFLMLLILFVGAKQEQSKSNVIPLNKPEEDIMHVDSLNTAVTKLEAATLKLNSLIR